MHKDIHEEYQVYQKTKRETPTKVSVKKRWSCQFEQQQFEENVTAFVSDNMLALSIIEKPSFRKIFDGMLFNIHIWNNLHCVIVIEEC